MAKSSQRATQKSDKVPATPKGVLIEPGHYTKMRPVVIGDTCWFPLPRHWNVTLERGIGEVMQINVAEDINPVSAPHAFFYKCGGATGDCVGSATVDLKDTAGKKTGGTRKATKKEILQRMYDRWNAIKDGTYVGVSKGPRGIPIPEELLEGIAVVASNTKKGKEWRDTLVRSFQSKILSRKDLESTLANTVACFGKTEGATPERITKGYTFVMTRVAKILSTRNTEWCEEDNDLLE